MNNQNLIGKLKPIVSDAKVWFGDKIGEGISAVGLDREQITVYLQTQFNSNRAKALEELEKFENARFIFKTRPHEAETKIGFHFNKLTNIEINRIEGDFERFVNKIREKYGKSKQEATSELKAFMGSFPMV